jgi:hypothetical protein
MEELFYWIISNELMSSPAITTIVKMVESLPDDLQEKVADHIREYIADLEDEQRWDASFKRTQENLVAAARKAKQEIAAGQSVPMDYEQLWSQQRCRPFGRIIENWAMKWEREQEKHTDCGQRTRFIHRYISSASTVKKEFGQSEWREAIVRWVF